MAFTINIAMYILDGVLVLGGLWVYLYYNYFDTRLQVLIIHPDKQVYLHKRKIKNDIIDVFDKKTGTQKLYTVNKDYVYYKRGKIPMALYWDNVPIPLDVTQNSNFSPTERKVLEKAYAKSSIQVNIQCPSIEMKKGVKLDTAETFFRVLYTNFTLNLLKKPQDLKPLIKWTSYLIVGGIAIAIIMHLTGMIDIFELLGTTAPNK